MIFPFAGYLSWLVGGSSGPAIPSRLKRARRTPPVACIVKAFCKRGCQRTPGCVSDQSDNGVSGNAYAAIARAATRLQTLSAQLREPRLDAGARAWTRGDGKSAAGFFDSEAHAEQPV